MSAATREPPRPRAGWGYHGSGPGGPRGDLKRELERDDASITATGLRFYADLVSLKVLRSTAPAAPPARAAGDCGASPCRASRRPLHAPYSRCPRPPRACCPGVLPHVRKAGRRRRKGTKPGAATYISAGHMSASFQGRYTRCVPAVVAGRCTRRVLAGSSGRCTRCVPADRRLGAYGALSAVLAGHSASSGKAWCSMWTSS